jgi:hypothetical protein
MLFLRHMWPMELALLLFIVCRTYIFWVRKLDFDSLTETKNWGSRNEAIETSGKLRPLWPQNKRLHSPRTTERLHAGQDKWIQKELAFTPAKNATKPNHFKIIPSQPTRKENNWETKETMERATLALETERAKWPKPGCLCCWWWWWWWWHIYIDIYLYIVCTVSIRSVTSVFPGCLDSYHVSLDLFRGYQTPFESVSSEDLSCLTV